MTAQTISLEGWTHVHTWHESHGALVQDTYQKEQNPLWPRRVECLVVSAYRDGRASGVRLESQHDYLLARTIRADEERYVVNGDRNISACCTSGYDDFRDVQTGNVYRVASVAGHGEWAFMVEEGQ